jgi:hypothetical protein
MPVWQHQNFSSIQRRSSMAASSLRSKITISPAAGKCVRDPNGLEPRLLPWIRSSVSTSAKCNPANARAVCVQPT